MRPIEESVLNRYRNLFPEASTSEIALNMAISAEQMCRDIGPFDPYFVYAKREQLSLEEMARLLEIEENEKCNEKCTKK